VSEARAPSASVRFKIVDPASDAAVVAMMGYFGELEERFENGFDADEALASDAEKFRHPHGALLVGFVSDDGDERPVVCGGITTLAPEVTEVKRVWVHPDARGAGLGREIMARLERLAAEAGSRIVRLDTNSVLTEAIRMYETSGYRSIDAYNDNPYARRWFEKEL